MVFVLGKSDVALSDLTGQIEDKKAILPNVLGNPVKRSRIQSGRKRKLSNRLGQKGDFEKKGSKTKSPNSMKAMSKDGRLKKSKTKTLNSTVF